MLNASTSGTACERRSTHRSTTASCERVNRERIRTSSSRTRCSRKGLLYLEQGDLLGVHVAVDEQRAQVLLHQVQRVQVAQGLHHAADRLVCGSRRQCNGSRQLAAVTSKTSKPQRLLTLLCDLADGAVEGAHDELV